MAMKLSTILIALSVLWIISLVLREYSYPPATGTRGRSAAALPTKSALNLPTEEESMDATY